MLETCNVFDAPTLEKYNSIEDAAWMNATLDFGNKLKADGVLVKYLHGPVGLYQNIQLIAKCLKYDTKFHWKTDGSVIYFLYQVRDDMIRFGELTTDEIRKVEELNK